MRLRDRFAPAQGIKHGVEGWHVQSLSVETRFARPADAENATPRKAAAKAAAAPAAEVDANEVYVDCMSPA